VELELGQFFARLGTQVTILLRGRTVLSQMDEAVGLVLEAALKEDGIEVVTEAQVRCVPVRGGAEVGVGRTPWSGTGFRG